VKKAKKAKRLKRFAKMKKANFAKQPPLNIMVNISYKSTMIMHTFLGAFCYP
jgi:hypothetical protein